MTRLRWLSAVLVVAAFTCFVVVLRPAAAGDLPKLKTKVHTLAAFKNGMGFVFRSGETPLVDGWAAMDEIPPAALGTFWVGTADPAHRVMQVVSCQEKVKETSQRDALTLDDLLYASVGKQVMLTYSLNGTQRAKVTILAVPGQGDGGSQGNMVVFQPEERGAFGTLAIPKGCVQAIEMSDLPKVSREVEKTVNRAKVLLSGSPKTAEITLAYLEKNVTWAPSYLVSLIGEKEADVTLEAVLVNDAEDLEDARVSFVVGYPHFAYADIITPLTLQRSVANLVDQLSAQGTYGGRAYAGVTVQSNVAGGYFFAADAAPSSWRPEGVSGVEGMAGEAGTDLYFYRQDHVTLKKGDRARYTVFTARVPCEDVYRWDVSDPMGVSDTGARKEPSAGDESSERVWHSLCLTNGTPQPWTTAPAFAVKGDLPMAQDTMKYAPPGAKTLLKLTVASDVSGSQQQTELSRQKSSYDPDRYDEVVVSGELSVRNWRDKPIRLTVCKPVVGEVLEAGEGGKVEKVAKRVSAVNPTPEITWEFDLGAGQSKTLPYRFRTLVHR